MAVEQIKDQAELRDFLTRDKLANAYLLGNLDPAFLPFCHWYGSRDAAGNIASLALLYTGLSLPLLFMVGGGPDFQEFLESLKEHLPARFHFHVLEPHIGIVQDAFGCSDTMRMQRMGLEKADYKPLDSIENVVRLGHRDTAAIMALYAHYPDNFFAPSQLETGLYFGVRGDDNRLLSIAGVHVVSEEYDVGVIGNLVTHPSARGQGLATLCTGQLLDELFERVSLVALNVQDDNQPAIKMYANFGFRQNNIFWEGRSADA